MSLSTNDLQEPLTDENNDGDGANGASALSECDRSPASHSASLNVASRECPLCFVRQPAHCFPRLSCCSHQSCHTCMVQYLQLEILESRVMVSCPECNEMLHPNDIHRILVDFPHLREKYEEFMLRRVLMFDADTRWCPAPDCNFAVIASNCAGCPTLHCERPGCGTYFCYHCKMHWHPQQTCDEARAERGALFLNNIQIDSSLRPGDIKACPRCRTYIVKTNDGSCNHMVCGLCGAEFCWLCLKEISDLHYLSPSGCTFWGTKPWSRKKKLLWQLGTLIGAPVGITLIAGLAVPAIIFGVPVYVGRKVNSRLTKRRMGKHKRRTLVATSVMGSLVVSPIIAGLTVGIGVPIMLAYVYGVVPISLCRTGGCGVSASTSGLNIDEPDWMSATTAQTGEVEPSEKVKLLRVGSQQHADTATVTGVSIGSGSAVTVPTVSRYPAPITVQAELYPGGAPHSHAAETRSTRARHGSMESASMNYEEASTKAMAGSTAQCYYADDKSVHTIVSEYGAAAQEGASVRALAGSVQETKSCGGVSDNVSMRVLTGSIGPDNLSARHILHPSTHDAQQQRNNDIDVRTSPAPLLEECVDETGVAIETSTSVPQAAASIDSLPSAHHHHRDNNSTHQQHSIHFSEDEPHRPVVAKCTVQRHATVTSVGSTLSANHRARSRAHSNVSRDTGGTSGGGDYYCYDDSHTQTQELLNPIVKHERSRKHRRLLQRQSVSRQHSNRGATGDVSQFQQPGTSVSTQHANTNNNEDAEFMLMSPEAFMQLHGGHPPAAAQTAKKSNSVSMLFDSGSASDFWHQLAESGAIAAEPWLVWDRVRPAMVRGRHAQSDASNTTAPVQSSTRLSGSKRAYSTSYTSLPGEALITVDYDHDAAVKDGSGSSESGSLTGRRRKSTSTAGKATGSRQHHPLWHRIMNRYAQSKQ